jgi:hypothetical protein
MTNSVPLVPSSHLTIVIRKAGGIVVSSETFNIGRVAGTHS